MTGNFAPKKRRVSEKALRWGSEYDGSIASMRFLLLKLLGARCSCSLNGGCWHDGPCRVDDDRCLHLDHINGDGADDRRRFSNEYRMYKHYLDHPDEAKQRLQVLCANCNWIKRYRNRETLTTERRWLNRLISPPPSTIQTFRGEYRFLSNFCGCSVDFEGLTYRSSEAAYQASKCTDTDDRVRFTRLSPSEAKRLGGSVMLRGDWEDVKVDVMHRVLRSKFSTEPMRKMLLNTGDMILEESNYWGDRFWGTYKGEGENYLGILLMIVRGEIQEGDI